jgi:hypothetical protein
VPADTPRVYFRIVETNPPTRYDFLSNEARGIVPRRPLTPRDRDRWHGVSHFMSYEAASSRIGDSPWLGNHVATIELPAHALVRIEQTGRDLQHFTVWADADDLLSWVASVEAIRSL